MKLGVVTRQVAVKKQAACWQEEKILLVELEGSSLAALDAAGAEPGDSVLLVMGNAAAAYCMAAPTDAVFVAVAQK